MAPARSRRTVRVAGLVGAAILAGGGVWADAGPGVTREPDRFVHREIRVHGVRSTYSAWVPPDYKASHASPCLVFLHGSGESGSDVAAPTRVGLGPQLVAHPERWPFLVLFPQKPTDQEEWEEHEDLVLAVLADARHHWRIDPDRTALTGMSQGGHGAWYLAARHPRLWSAVVPVCGYGRARTIASRIAGLPVWAFHGLRDDVVEPREAELIVEELRRLRSSAGGDTMDTRLTLYPGANHDSWDSAYAEPELPEWLLARRREGKR